MLRSKKSGLTVDEILAKLKHYCTYQDRCHQEVEQKLNEFLLHPEAKEYIMVKLIEEGFLNEERFARSFARGKFYQKHWGKNKIVQELIKRGISERLIQAALHEIDEEDYRSTIQILFQKKLSTTEGANTKEREAKAIRYLLGKGYAYSDILEATSDR